MRSGTPATTTLVTELVTEHTVLSAVLGSHAYGLATEASDVDRRGVYVAPTELYWRFDKPPTSVTGPEPEQLSWEVEHFCALALKANPTVLELLVVPDTEVCTELGAELRALLPAFLSQRAATSFRRATERQLNRVLAAAAREQWRPKLFLHSIRLLVMCERLLRTGSLTIDMTGERDRLLAVRGGDLGWDDSWAWVHEIEARIDTALVDTPLPRVPDTERVQDWLVSVRRRALREEA